MHDESSPRDEHLRELPLGTQPSQPAGTIYLIDRAASRRIDVEAVEKYGLTGLMLMENAARAVAEQALRMLDRRVILHGGTAAKSSGREPHRPRVAIVCGAGNNGGDGYAAARHLQNAGCCVTLIAIGRPRPDSDAAVNAEICQRMGVPLVEFPELVAVVKQADLVIDALFGTGLDRDVTDRPAEVIALLNELARPTLAVDTPSGLDCQTGRELREAVRARCTVTFVGIKPGFLKPAASQITGAIMVAGIGAPMSLVAEHARPLAEGDLPPGMTPPRLI